MENKRKICALLLEAIQSTDRGRDLVELEYFDNEFTDDAHVDARYADGYRIRIDVTADNGIAMIKDIVGKLP